MRSGAQPPIGSTWYLGSVSEPRPPVGCSPRVRPFPPRPPPEVAFLCSVAIACRDDPDYPGHGNPVADESSPLFRAAEAEPGQRQDRALDALVRGRGGDPGHDASRHIRGHGEVRDRAVAPDPTSTNLPETGAAVRQAASTTVVRLLARGALFTASASRAGGSQRGV